ncbi:hypothetical protein GY21_02115 [Cryobacterium roopkundense]|uniref:Regulator of SigK n=1 Tax=Cryobacterium roopkundense TaxID=1001240 RepID=A0A099JRL1_9MICO|nr:anti-sigma factor [Cryobacterium roopkundense]KGJ80790.1 hypothetical protein GY21_02115 [Cryobacterium roopkundense]MBB5639686.1 anti-sigma-K factor RskA [Cryobacterium roopkundense]
MTSKAPHDDATGLSGAYALNALGPEDTAAFEAYLAESEPARTEVAELSDTAVALGLAVVPVQPSAALRANLMSMIASTPQQSPLSAPAAVPPTIPTAPLLPELGEDGNVVSLTSGSTGRAAQRARQRWFQRPVQVLVAAAAAAVLFVGGTFAGQSFNNNQFEQAQAAGLVEINAAPDSQRAAATTADGQPATLVWSNSLGLSAVMLEDLPALASDQDYQLWYINDSGAAPAGTFDSTGSGTAWRVLDGSMHAGDAVGVTVEPSGGSEQPTSAPIVAFQS